MVLLLLPDDTSLILNEPESDDELICIFKLLRVCKCQKEYSDEQVIDEFDPLKYEEVNENYDDTPEEVSMVRTELKAMIADAQDLLDNMPSDMHIEPWVQSKISVAKSMVNGVHDYMLYSDDTDKPADMRSTMPSITNPFGTNEEVDLDEKLSPEQLKKFAKLAPPYNKITHADKIVAVKKKEAGQKVLPEASAIKSHAMNMAKQAINRLKYQKNKHTMHTKMDTPKDKLNMNKGEK
jgi:hypothetical protein